MRCVKSLKRICATTLVGILWFAGCSSSTPYQIVDKADAPQMKVLYVEVPKGATQSELAGWASELKASQSVNGKRFMINFYEGKLGAKNMIATYQGSKLYKMK